MAARATLCAGQSPYSYILASSRCGIGSRYMIYVLVLRPKGHAGRPRNVTMCKGLNGFNVKATHVTRCKGFKWIQCQTFRRQPTAGDSGTAKAAYSGSRGGPRNAIRRPPPVCLHRTIPVSTTARQWLGTRQCIAPRCRASADDTATARKRQRGAWRAAQQPEPQCGVQGSGNS
jgi:hypothetical protein